MVRKGKFIVFEGIDGAGSTTQIELLYKYLINKKILVAETCEPTTGTIGRLIRDVLQKKIKVSAKSLQLLFCADRADHLENEIIPSINAGKIILSDRYFFSTIAYGVLGLDWDWLKSLNKSFLLANATFVLNVPAKVATSRINKRSDKVELFEKEKVLEKVAKNYLRLAREYKNTYVLDGTNARLKIHEKVLEILRAKKIIND